MISQWMPSVIKRWCADTSAVAAVEFAMILPLLALFLVGTFETCRAITAERRTTQIANMVADVIAREQNVTSADVLSIYASAAQLLAGFDTSKLRISLVPVAASPSDATKTRVYAAITNRPGFQGGDVLVKCAPYTVTQGLLKAGDSVIVVDAEYTYASSLIESIGTSFSFRRLAVFAPREGCVDFDNNDCVWSCT